VSTVKSDFPEKNTIVLKNNQPKNPKKPYFHRVIVFTLSIAVALKKANLFGSMSKYAIIGFSS
jgi:hypothetical protein